MKFNKNNLQLVTLMIATFSIVVTIFSTISNSEALLTDSTIILSLATGLTTILFASYALLLLRRINPKQYIYISYSRKDNDTALLISETLSKQLEKLSKYRFEIITADSISYGEDMYSTMQKNIEQSEIILILVSQSYIHSKWCINEFTSIMDMNKKIIPIVMESFEDLSQLPKDISNIKALSFIEASSGKKFEEQLLRLSKDLIRQRKN